MSKLKTVEKQILYYLIAGFLLAIMLFVMLQCAINDSGTVDEIAHIPAGYSYVKYHDYRLNPEHPPLAKALAGLPLSFMKINGFENDWSWQKINQWEAGWHFIYELGNDPNIIIFWSRLPMILLSLGLGLILLIWATKWYGRKIGLLALLLFAFYPDILGHGHLVTTDVAAAFGFVITIMTFGKLMERRTWQNIAWASLAFAVAQLLKFSSFLLFGILLLLIIYRAYLDRDKENTIWKNFKEYFKTYLLVCIFSVIVVWLVYIPFVWNTPATVEHQVIEINLLPNEQRTEIIRNFLHHFENNPLSRALGHYILGIIMVVARVAGGNATYIMGHLSEKSISWFFPVAYLIKTPVPILLMFLWAIVSLAVFRSKNKKDAWENALILTPIIVYWAFTLKGSLNIGIRHLLPTIPFVIMFIAKNFYRYLGKNAILSWQTIWIAILVVWYVLGVIWYYPQYIAYFNFFINRDHRYQYLVDSSLDWGQDMYRLRDYINENNIDSIKIDYFGGSVPKYYIPQYNEWHSAYGPTTGWIAVSATYYQSSKLYGPKEGTWSYEWLDNFEPEAIIGGSILVYNISLEDLAEHQPTSSYPITSLKEPGSILSNQD